MICDHLQHIDIVVLGTSAGGMNALGRLLPRLPEGFPLPVVIVQHLHPDQDGFLVDYFGGLSSMKIKEAQEKEPVVPGICYLAPPDYHLLIERDKTFSLSSDEKVNHSRPSIDVLFESAAVACGPGTIAVILTGASKDGAEGLKAIRSRGGIGVVQNPASAEYPYMPQAALDIAGADHILSLDEIGSFLLHCADPGPPQKKNESP